MQNITFGTLTSKTVHNIDFEDFDLDKDGVITQDELDTVTAQNNFDILDLSSIDKDADQKVTKEEYELWQQEVEMKQILDNIKQRVSRDFIGHSSEEIKTFLGKLNDFQVEFEKDYRTIHSDITNLAEDFKRQLPIKYAELRKEVLLNSNDAVKQRVIENVIEDLSKDNKGRAFSLLAGENKLTFSDNAKRILSTELSKQADKFIKQYKGENLENDLTAFLTKFLATSDKEKLSDAINMWENQKKELESIPSEIRFKQLKDSVKNFLFLCLEQDITPKVGDITVRTEVAIIPAITQYKDAETLKNALDKIIKELSEKSKAEELQDSFNQESQNNFFLKSEDLENNIFNT